ncbi:hypothetical protein FHS27_000070 [Rhodopirellula rubra]|uniref:Uncharacterized protein n=1 Tax=Aporhodopirellula rubra TaxID=980271 RepID=A0A7W5H3Z3_9BACT|nr:hypothetical protein [Aporhodopirellula rubra]
MMVAVVFTTKWTNDTKAVGGFLSYGLRVSWFLIAVALLAAGCELSVATWVKAYRHRRCLPMSLLRVIAVAEVMVGVFSTTK